MQNVIIIVLIVAVKKEEKEITLEDEIADRKKQLDDEIEKASGTGMTDAMNKFSIDIKKIRDKYKDEDDDNESSHRTIHTYEDDGPNIIFGLLKFLPGIMAFIFVIFVGMTIINQVISIMNDIGSATAGTNSTNFASIFSISSSPFSGIIVIMLLVIPIFVLISIFFRTMNVRL